MKRTMRIAVVLAIAAMSTGCQTAPTTTADRDLLMQEATESLNMFQVQTPGLKVMMNQAAGYAIFPSVGKGAAGIGGAYGRGLLYEGGQMTGYCDLTQASIGLQLGGQSYRELILFQNASAIEQFKRNKTAMSAGVSAVVVTAGAAATADYDHGIMIYIMARGGLMYEASVGGQRFTYVPK